MGLFITWLRHASAEEADAGGQLVSGPGMESARGMTVHAVASGGAPADIVALLYACRSARDRLSWDSSCPRPISLPSASDRPWPD